MIPLLLFLLAAAAVYLGAIGSAFSALMRLSLRLLAERSDRQSALGAYLDDPLMLFAPVRLLLGLIFSSLLLTFLVPSGIACVVIMAAVALGLMDVFGLSRGSNVGRGIFVTLTYTAGIFDIMVIAGASSILGRGLIQKTTGIEVYWSEWLLAFLPCVVVTIVVIWRLVLRLFPPEKEALEGGVEFLNQSDVRFS